MSNQTVSLSDQAAHGGRWTGLSAMGTVLIQVTQLAVLGRILTPGDFGLMAMMLVFIGLASALADLGLVNHLIRVKVMDGFQVGGVLLASLIASILLAGTIAIASPWIASFYNNSLLVEFFPVLSLVVIFSSLAALGSALLQRNLQFKPIAMIEIIASLLSFCLGYLLAIMGKGVWSLIAAQLAMVAFKSSASWIYLLTACHLRLGISWRGFAEALKFGAFQMGERILNFAWWNIDKVIIAKILGQVSVGIYSIAYQLALRPFSVLNPIFTRVALPLFANIQEDNNRLSRGYLQTIRVISLFSFPIYIFMILAAESIISVMLGPQWAQATGVFRILAALGFVFSLSNPIGALLLAKGRADLGFYLNFFALIAYGIAFYSGSSYGIKGVAFAFVIAAYCIMFPLEFFIRWRLVKMHPSIYITAIYLPVLGAFFSFGAVFSLQSIVHYKHSLVTDFGLGLIGVVVFFIFMWVVDRPLLLNTIRLFLRR